MTKLLSNLVASGTVTIRDALGIITKNSKQVALVVDPDYRLLGIVTDGDLRKAILRGADLETRIEEIMNRRPIVGEPAWSDSERLACMQEKGIRHLPIVDRSGRLVELALLGEMLSAPTVAGKGFDRVAIIGLGYVGVTLAAVLAKRGIAVVGFDKNPAVIEQLHGGRCHVFEPGVETILRKLLGSRLFVDSELPDEPVDAAIICVSTPLDLETRVPDMGNLRAAARVVAQTYPPETLVVVRSTVSVGATRSVVLPELLARWGQARLAFCPERTIQGQALRELEELPQVVGGLDRASRDAAAALFSRLTDRVVLVSSLEAAEMVKLVNNCHTDLIYSFGNEVALMAEGFGLDPLEIIRAANTDYPRPDLSKPGFVGGSCLSKDPYILMSSTRASGYSPWLVGHARGLNEYLPVHVAHRFLDLMRETRGSLDGARIFLMGFAYKGWPPTDDMRGAPVLPMLELFRKEPVALLGHDYLVSPETIAGYGVTPCDPEEGFEGSDGVLVITDHPDYAKLDLSKLLERLHRPAVLYDCWRILDEAAVRSVGGIRYAGIGYG
jgi:UDP-N-acetyl-D-mannosaminuronic acid dehydrogenase